MSQKDRTGLSSADIERAKTAWEAGRRDGDPSYEDLRSLLEGAVGASYAAGEDEWAYVADFSDDWVVFSKQGEKFRCSYTIDGDTVTLGDPEQVKTVTSYEPVQMNSAPPAADTTTRAAEGSAAAETAPVTSQGANWATPKRAGFSSLVEQPPAHQVDIQVRMADDGHIGQFLGYASTTGVAYPVRDWLGEYRETINPGAFAKTLREQGDVPLLFNHDGVPLASTSSGTSRLSEDSKGLRNEADLDRRDALTNSICVQLDRGVLSKMSFSFRAVKEAWNDTYDERGVNEAALYDTSIVTYPANDATDAALVEEMRSALGREGRSLWLADSELSVRSTLPAFLEHGELPDEGGDLLERALRALAHADEVVSRANGPHGRARTFLVANAMLELRAGKTLSSKNEGLLKQALDALAAADSQHQQLADNHTAAAEKVQSVLDSTSSQSNNSDDGQDNQTPPGNDNPISPKDGAGPRALPPAVAHARSQVSKLRRR